MNGVMGVKNCKLLYTSVLHVTLLNCVQLLVDIQGWFYTGIRCSCAVYCISEYHILIIALYILKCIYS